MQFGFPSDAAMGCLSALIANQWRGKDTEPAYPKDFMRYPPVDDLADAPTTKEQEQEQVRRLKETLKIARGLSK